jgi:hypothetical protein
MFHNTEKIMSQFEPNLQFLQNKKILYNFDFQILYFKNTKILKKLCHQFKANSQLKFLCKVLNNLQERMFHINTNCVPNLNQIHNLKLNKYINYIILISKFYI